MFQARDDLAAITEKADNNLGDIQPWPGYYRLRKREIELFFSIYPIKKVDSILEIGCGNAFNAAMFSNKGDFIVASDLAVYDGKTHSIGIDRANTLINTLDVKNCRLASCSAQKLPFSDNSFDIVFSMYVMEHLPDKDAAVEEMTRVLKKEGVIISIVPNFVERIFAPISMYSYFIKKIFKHLFNKNGGKDDNLKEAGGFESSPANYSFLKFRKNYPHFPFPEPHGEYKDSLEELIAHLPWKWMNLFRRNGLSITDIFTTMVYPKNLIEIIDSELGLKIYEKSTIQSALGTLPLIKYMGQNLCIICKKEGEESK